MPASGELLDVDGCAFQVVDWERKLIRPAAAWFADEETREALAAVLTRPYDPERPGVTEAAIERGEPLLIAPSSDWPGAEALRRRLAEELDPDAAARAWAWYESSSYISCPVRTAGGRTLGVLAISRAHPQPPLTTEDLRVVEVFADLAALALERARQAREQEMLNRASLEVGRLLEPEAVYRAAVEQALVLTGAPKGFLARFEPATEELRIVAARRLHERRRAHALQARRGHDRPRRRQRRAVPQRRGRHGPLPHRVRRARARRLVRPRADRRSGRGCSAC